MRWQLIVMLSILVVLGGITWVQLRSQPGTGTGINPGQKAPDFTLPTLDGSQDVSLSSLRGQPVVINFFATWCGPCRDELPELAESTELADRAHVVLVNLLGSERSRDDVVRYLASEGIDLLTLADGKNAVAEIYGVRAIPFTIILDETGTVIYRHTGVITAQQILDRLP